MAYLKSCPFCGSDNLFIIHNKKYKYASTRRYVECQNCGATASIETWNNRVDAPSVYTGNDVINRITERLKELKNEKELGSHKVMIQEAIEIVKEEAEKNEVER